MARIRQKKKTSGYRGFAEVGYSVGSWVHRLEITTSHGYQILPYLFTGIGTGILRGFGSGKKQWDIPIFADIRYDILKKPLTPFIDLKIGGTVWEDAGFYMSPTIGCRFPFDETIGLNIRLGYSMKRVQYWEEGWYEWTDDRSDRVWHDASHKGRNRGAFTISVGVDF